MGHKDCYNLYRDFCVIASLMQLFHRMSNPRSPLLDTCMTEYAMFLEKNRRRLYFSSLA